MSYSLGIIALTVFPRSLRELIVQEVISKGQLVLSEAEQCQRKRVQVEPALGFLRADLNEDELTNILRALRVVLGDALAGQWDTTQYATALIRAASVPADEALRIAKERIVTKDASLLSFARRMLQAAPDIPGPFDNAAYAALGGVLTALDQLPTDWTNSSGDVLYEWFNLGEELGRLATRTKLIAHEVQYEKSPMTDAQSASARDQAMTAIPFLARALVGLLSNRMETGDLADGDRTEIGDLLAEAGDLMTEGYYTSPEQGGLGSFLKKVGRFAGKAVKTIGKAAGPLMAIAGNAILPGIGGVVGGVLGSALSNDSNKKAVTGAHQAANKLPPTPINPTSGRVSLGDLVRMTHQLREAGVAIA